jgi:hypothetical protein
MPETGENVPEDARAAQDAAWASFHDATVRRRRQHDLVRSIVRRRAEDGFADEFGRSMEPKERS